MDLRTGQELIKRWNIHDFQLFDYVKKGLQPYYNNLDLPMKNPDLEKTRFLRREKIDKVFALKEKIKASQNEKIIKSYKKEIRELNEESRRLSAKLKENDFSWENYELPKFPKRARTVINSLLEALYKTADISEVEKNRGKEVPHNDRPVPENQPPQKKGNFFVLEGDIWRVRFEGKESPIPNLNGIWYIVMVLSQRGKPVSCLELTSAIEGKSLGKAMNKAQKEEEGLNDPSYYKELTAVKDPLAKEDYKNRLKELLADREKYERENDSVVLQYINQEIEDIERVLSEKIMDNSFPRKAQINIIQQLKKAYIALKKRGMGHISDHLKGNIKPAGKYNYYYTDSNTEWDWP